MHHNLFGTHDASGLDSAHDFAIMRILHIPRLVITQAEGRVRLVAFQALTLKKPAERLRIFPVSVAQHRPIIRLPIERIIDAVKPRLRDQTKSLLLPNFQAHIIVFNRKPH